MNVIINQSDNTDSMVFAQGDFMTTRRDFLYPQRVLAKLFRGKMVSALRQDYDAGKLHRIAPGQIDAILDKLMRTDWVIHTKPHLRQPDNVLRYLARYTHRTAISLSRIESVDQSSVRFRWKDYRDDQIKTMVLPGAGQAAPKYTAKTGNVL